MFTLSLLSPLGQLRTPWALGLSLYKEDPPSAVEKLRWENADCGWWLVAGEQQISDQSGSHLVHMSSGDLWRSSLPNSRPTEWNVCEVGQLSGSSVGHTPEHTHTHTHADTCTQEHTCTHTHARIFPGDYLELSWDAAVEEVAGPPGNGWMDRKTQINQNSEAVTYLTRLQIQGVSRVPCPVLSSTRLRLRNWVPAGKPLFLVKPSRRLQCSLHCVHVATAQTPQACRLQDCGLWDSGGDFGETEWRLWGRLASPPFYLPEAATICQKECNDCQWPTWLQSICNCHSDGISEPGLLGRLCSFDLILMPEEASLHLSHMY